MATVTISSADFLAAKHNDLSAIKRVTDELLPQIDAIAYRLAQETGGTSSDLHEELSAEGRLILWELVSKFEGMSEEKFGGWLKATIRKEMIGKRRALTEPGAGEKEIKVFRACLREAQGDADLAEKYARRVPNKKDRLSAESARAARLAVTKSLSLDAQMAPTGRPGQGPDSTLLDLLADKPYVDPALSTTKNSLNRAAMVNATLDRMTSIQADVLRNLYYHEMSPEVAAEEMGTDVRKLQMNHYAAKKRFWTLFPFETTYNAPKPPMHSERGQA